MESKRLVDDKTKINIEIGAGCGTFGNAFFFPCYETEKDTSYSTLCEPCKIDFFCDACKLPWSDNRFEKIIMCNPWGYGFEDIDDATLLLKELSRVLIDKGNILIVSRFTNKFGAAKRIETTLNHISIDNVSFSFSAQQISDNYLTHDFYITSLGKITIPTDEVIINVRKQ